ncbi:MULTISPECIES: DUF2919 family protein [Rheinheimera]|uniref:DUF2919 family protein n=1 Tax=Rheinheimera marina TaxID=1774958 RepID=A0ABV9JKL7_9GAMM
MKRYFELDDHGLVRIPWMFYALLLVLLRPYLLWVVVLTMREGGDSMLKMIYPHSEDFMLACLIALPALVLTLVLSQRKDKGWRRCFVLWRHCRWPLIATALLDLGHSLTHLPAFVTVTAPWLLLAPITLAIGALWLVRSYRLKLVLSEWPEPAASGVKSQ